MDKKYKDGLYRRVEVGIVDSEGNPQLGHGWYEHDRDEQAERNETLGKAVRKWLSETPWTDRTAAVRETAKCQHAAYNRKLLTAIADALEEERDAVQKDE